MIECTATRRGLLGLLPLLLLVPLAQLRAEEREILGDELVTLLRGKTIKGTWRGTPYTQWFAPDGRTSYTVQGAVDWGHWHLGDTGNYCSTWSRGGLSCYRVLLKDGDYYWQSVNGGALEPFSVE